MQEIVLKTPSLSGKITVGAGALERRLPSLVQGQKNFVVIDENVLALHGEVLKKYFSVDEFFIFPSGEEYKNFDWLQAILTEMTRRGLHRTSRLFAVGGGVVGDIGGLAAALYMRGISCVQIPTTLLSQIDSSVGGKTAVDLGGVKNVVGAFYQPCEVLVDPAFLATLPEREIKCGVGEMVKYAALNGEIFDRLHSNIDKLTNLPFLTSLIVDCIRHKAAVVQADEKERGERKSLNVGHTTGHAIELTYGFSHGESVLLGMLYETKAAIRRGVCEREYGNQLLEIVQAALRISPCPEKDYTEYDVPACAQKAKSDKKNTDDGNIVMTVAKAKGEWALLSLPYTAYVDELEQAK